MDDPNRSIRITDHIRVPVTLSLVALAVYVCVRVCRKPPYGVSRWEWHVDPLITVFLWTVFGSCRECGMKRIHKMDCTRRGQEAE